jgi:hypothetical protein
MSDKVILYGSPTCAAVPLARGVLERAGVAFEYMKAFGNLHDRFNS